MLTSERGDRRSPCCGRRNWRVQRQPRRECRRLPSSTSTVYSTAQHLVYTCVHMYLHTLKIINNKCYLLKQYIYTKLIKSSALLTNEDGSQSCPSYGLWPILSSCHSLVISFHPRVLSCHPRVVSFHPHVTSCHPRVISCYPCVSSIVTSHHSHTTDHHPHVSCQYCVTILMSSVIILVLSVIYHVTCDPMTSVAVRAWTKVYECQQDVYKHGLDSV